MVLTKPRRGMPESSQRYWDRDLETMNSAGRDEVILDKVRALLRYAYDNSVYYHDLYHKIDLDIDSITSLESFNRKVPLTTKAIVRDEQMRHPPYGGIITSATNAAPFVMASSGTTGRPTYIPFSGDDLEVIADRFARIMWSFGVRPGMKIMIAAQYSFYAGSWGAMLGAERLGLSIIPAGAGAVGTTEKSVQVANVLKPDIIYGTPSYIFHFLEKSKENGVDPAKDYNFKIVWGSGEPGLSVPAVKNRLKSILSPNLKVIDSGTMVEGMPWLSSCECEFEIGPHLWQDIVYTEVVDSESENGRLLEFGGEGVLVYTALDRRLYPLIRYFSGDVSTWVDEECPCGRTYPRLPLGIYGRYDDMIVMKGIKTWPVSIQETLEKSKWYNGEFRIVLTTEEATDTMKLIVEITPEAMEAVGRDPPRKGEIASEFRTLVRNAIGLTPLVEIAEPSSIERFTHKARRVVDERTTRKELSRMREKKSSS